MKSGRPSRDWAAIERAIDREDLDTLRSYVNHADRTDPLIMSNPVDAMARHTYYRLAARTAPPPTSGISALSGQQPLFEAPGKPSLRYKSSPRTPNASLVALSGPMGRLAKRFLPAASSSSSAATQPSNSHRQHSALDVRVALDSILSSPSDTLQTGGHVLAAREAEERDDVMDLELYEVSIIQRLGEDSLLTVLRRAGNRMLIRLGVEESSARQALEESYVRTASDIGQFLRAWRRGPVMEQNNLLVNEGLTRSRIEQGEEKAWHAIVSEAAYVSEMTLAENVRLRRLRYELSKASLLHQRVALLHAVLDDSHDASSLEMTSSPRGKYSRSANQSSCGVQ